MEPEIKKILDQQTETIDAIYSSVEKTRKYFLWTLIISIVVIVLPLLGLLIVIPKVLSLYTSGLGGLGL